MRIYHTSPLPFRCAGRGEDVVESAARLGWRRILTERVAFISTVFGSSQPANSPPGQNPNEWLLLLTTACSYVILMYVVST